MAVRSAWLEGAAHDDGPKPIVPSGTSCSLTTEVLEGSKPLSGEALCVDESEVTLDALLARFETALAAGDGKATLALVERGQRRPFLYKRRRCLGSALHIVVQHKDGEDVARQLIQLKADIHEECRYMSFDKEATAQPIHLAVQSGQPAMLQLLLEAGADIDAKATREGEDHFGVLHEAVFFRQVEVVQFLVESDAEVNMQNLEGMTPLHVATKVGAADVVEVLVRFNASIEMQDNKDRTALKVAVESGVFPHRHLHLLATWRIGDIMTVAEHCPHAVADFMRDLSAGASVGNRNVSRAMAASRLQRQGPLTVAHWIELMDEAPEAGALLLDVLTVEPEEDSVFYHPLPTQACVCGEAHCEYNEDETWRCNTETGRSRPWPDWHDRLAPGCETIIKKMRTATPVEGNWGVESISLVVRRQVQSVQNAAGLMGVSASGEVHTKSELNPVHIRTLKLPGMICPKVLHMLSETSYLDIFKNKAAQSILQYAWHRFVRRYYTVQLIHRVCEIAVLVTWTFSEHYWDDTALSGWLRRMCWSFVFVSSLRETVREASEAWCYIYIIGEPQAYFLNLGNYMDMGAIGLFNLFSWTSMHDLQLNGDPRIFSAVALFRWIQLLYTLRAYSLGKLGSRGIIPILQSLKEIGGILVICVFTFVAFTHAFLALDQNPENWQLTVLSTFRFLFLGDGEGINAILTLGNYEMNGITITFIFFVMATIVFCISLLNLFIAVHGEAYAEARRDCLSLHLQERASICLHCMMQPRWPPPPWMQRRLGCFGGRLSRPIASYILLCIVALAAWAGLLLIEELHAAVPSLVLLAAFLLGNCFLVQRPWINEVAAARSYVWWCAPLNDRAESTGPNLESISERLNYLENGMEVLLSEVRALSQQRGERRQGRASSVRVSMLQRIAEPLPRKAGSCQWAS